MLEPFPGFKVGAVLLSLSVQVDVALVFWLLNVTVPGPPLPLPGPLRPSQNSPPNLNFVEGAPGHLLLLLFDVLS